LQGRIDDREALLVLLERNIGNAEHAACKGGIGRKPALLQGQRRKLKLVYTCYDAPFRGFKTWNAVNDSLIKISSDVIAALER
jgi:hypothetical protein